MDARESAPTPTTRHSRTRMRLIALALALTAAAPVAAQVAVGQQIEVRGVTHEIVSFDFVSFEGAVHQILVPAPIQIEEIEGLRSELLSSYVSVRYRPYAGCGEADDPPHEVAGFPATVTGVYGFYDMSHSQSITRVPVQGDIVAGANSLWNATNAAVCLHVTDTTDLMLTFNVSWRCTSSRTHPAGSTTSRWSTLRRWPRSTSSTTRCGSCCPTSSSGS